MKPTEETLPRFCQQQNLGFAMSRALAAGRVQTALFPPPGPARGERPAREGKGASLHACVHRWWFLQQSIPAPRGTPFTSSTEGTWRPHRKPSGGAQPCGQMGTGSWLLWPCSQGEEPGGACASTLGGRTPPSKHQSPHDNARLHRSVLPTGGRVLNGVLVLAWTLLRCLRGILASCRAFMSR